MVRLLKLDDATSTRLKEFFVKKRIISFISGAGVALAVILVIYFIFWFLQSSSFPIRNLFDYLTQSNYTIDTSNYYSYIQAEDSSLFFEFELTAENTGILYKSAFEHGVTLKNLTNPNTELGVMTENGWRLVDLREIEKPATIRLELEKGGRLFLSSKPFTGNIA